MAGFPQGASGRQDDLASMAAMKRYETVVENTENGFATAVEMALKICKIIPTLKPDDVHKTDLDAKIECEVKLKASDPIEADRKATLGDRLWNGGMGAIDLRTNLIEYQGYSEGDAEEIIENILIDKVTLQSPEVAELMAYKLAEKAGLAEDLEILRMKRAMAEQQAKDLQSVPTPSEQTRTQGEVRTGQGREMIDQALVSRGSRRPPERYTQR